MRTLALMFAAALAASGLAACNKKPSDVPAPTATTPSPAPMADTPASDPSLPSAGGAASAPMNAASKP